MEYRNVTHVLFDLDGLLVDSESIFVEVYGKVCKKYHKDFTVEHYYHDIMGFQALETAEKLVKSLNLPLTKEEFQSEFSKETKSLLANVKLMPGAEKLVTHLSEKGVPIALATSSDESEVELKMNNHMHVLKLFNHCTMGSDPEVTKGKPDPATFMVCSSRFPDKPQTENCLVFEDSVNGVKAARTANMQVVFVPDARLNLEDFHEATLTLKSLEDFRPELFGLPAYD